MADFVRSTASLGSSRSKRSTAILPTRFVRSGQALRSSLAAVQSFKVKSSSKINFGQLAGFGISWKA